MHLLVESTDELFDSFFSKKMDKTLVHSKFRCNFAAAIGALAHLVERNTGSVEVSGSSPLCSTKKASNHHGCLLFLCPYSIIAAIVILYCCTLKVEIA